MTVPPSQDQPGPYGPPAPQAFATPVTPGFAPPGFAPPGFAAPGFAPPSPSAYAQPAPVQPALPPAFVDLTVQGSAMTASMVPPRVRVNGWEVQGGYGRRVVPVAPGHVRVDAEAQWWRTYGQATLEFTAAPGQTVPVFYATPYNVFSRGAVGHVKQRRPGALGMWLTFGVLALIVVGITVLASLAP